MLVENERRITIDKKRKKQLLIFIIIVLIILAVALCAWYFTRTPEQGDGSAYVDPNASDWGEDNPDGDKIEGRILIPGYSYAVMNSGDTQLAISIGNPKQNTCYLQATLSLEDGTVLFESGLLEPGKGFESVPLNQTLSPGTYQAMVTYQGYTMEETPQALNSSDSAFTLQVN